MKMHSYMAVNGYLQGVDKKATEVRDRLKERTNHVGGWDQAVADARNRREELDQQETTPSETPALAKGGNSYLNSEPAATALRNRLNHLQVPRSIKRNISSNSLAPESPGTPPTPAPMAPPQHPLVDHPDKGISSLALEYSELEGELTSNGKNKVRWPANLTWANYIDYQLLPTLVYELEYPRTDRYVPLCTISDSIACLMGHFRIRPMYVLEKTVATFGTFFLLYQYTEHYIIPNIPQPGQSFWRSLLDLALPFMVCYLILFYLMFGTSRAMVCFKHSTF